MKITTHGTTYEIKKYDHGWTLGTPKVVTSRKTGESRTELEESYHMTLGQTLAVIAEKELGKAVEVLEIMKIVERLREDLLNIK